MEKIFKFIANLTFYLCALFCILSIFFGFLIFIILLILQLCNVINSWLLVFTPMIAFCISLIMFVVFNVIKINEEEKERGLSIYGIH